MICDFSVTSSEEALKYIYNIIYILYYIYSLVHCNPDFAKLQKLQNHKVTKSHFVTNMQHYCKLFRNFALSKSQETRHDRRSIAGLPSA